MLGAQPRQHCVLPGPHRAQGFACRPSSRIGLAARRSCVAAARGKREQAGGCQSGLAAAAPRLLAAAAAGLLLAGQPALADIQTVAPGDATAAARPLKAQSVNKGKVWLLFLGSAFALFGTAVAVERNGALFPAIARANRAMEASKARMKVRLSQAKQEQQEEEAAIEVEAESERRTEDAVLQGLSLARDKSFQPSSSGPTGTDGGGGPGPEGRADGGAGPSFPEELRQQEPPQGAQRAAEPQAGSSPGTGDAGRQGGKEKEESVVGSPGKS